MSNRPSFKKKIELLIPKSLVPSLGSWPSGVSVDPAIWSVDEELRISDGIFSYQDVGLTAGSITVCALIRVVNSGRPLVNLSFEILGASGKPIYTSDSVMVSPTHSVGEVAYYSHTFSQLPTTGTSSLLSFDVQGTIELEDIMVLQGTEPKPFLRLSDLSKYTVEWEKSHPEDEGLFPQPLYTSSVVGRDNSTLVLQRMSTTIDLGQPSSVFQSNDDEDNYIDTWVVSETSSANITTPLQRVSIDGDTWVQVSYLQTVSSPPVDIIHFNQGNQTNDVPRVIEFDVINSSPAAFYFMFGTSIDGQSRLKQTYYFGLNSGNWVFGFLSATDITTYGMDEIEEQTFAATEPVDGWDSIVKIRIEVDGQHIRAYARYTTDDRYFQILGTRIKYPVIGSGFGLATAESLAQFRDIHIQYSSISDRSSVEIDNYKPYYDVSLLRSWPLPESTDKVLHRSSIPVARLNCSNTLPIEIPGHSRPAFGDYVSPKMEESRRYPLGIEIMGGPDTISVLESRRLVRVLVTDRSGCPLSRSTVKVSVRGGGWLANPFDLRSKMVDTVVETDNDGVATLVLYPPDMTGVCVARFGGEDELTNTKLRDRNLNLFSEDQYPIFLPGPADKDYSPLLVYSESLDGSEVKVTSSDTDPLTDLANEFDWIWGTAADHTPEFETAPPFDVASRFPVLDLTSILDAYSTSADCINRGKISATVVDSEAGTSYLHPVRTISELRSDPKSFVWDDGNIIILSNYISSTTTSITVSTTASIVYVDEDGVLTWSGANDDIGDHFYLVYPKRITRLTAEAEDGTITTLDIRLQNDQFLSGQSRLVADDPPGHHGGTGDGVRLISELFVQDNNDGSLTIGIEGRGPVGLYNEVESSTTIHYLHEPQRLRWFNGDTWVGITGNSVDLGDVNAAMSGVPNRIKVAICWPDDQGDMFSSPGTKHLSDLTLDPNVFDYNYPDGIPRNLEAGALDRALYVATFKTFDNADGLLSTDYLTVRTPDRTPITPPKLLNESELIDTYTVSSYHHKNRSSALETQVDLESGMHVLKIASGAGQTGYGYLAGLMLDIEFPDGDVHTLPIGNPGTDPGGFDYLTYSEAESSSSGKEVRFWTNGGNHKLAFYFLSSKRFRFRSEARIPKIVLTFDFNSVDLTDGLYFDVSIPNTNNSSSSYRISFGPSSDINNGVVSNLLSTVETCRDICLALAAISHGRLSCGYDDVDPDVFEIRVSAVVASNGPLTVSDPGSSIGFGIGSSTYTNTQQNNKVEINLLLKDRKFPDEHAPYLIWYNPDYRIGQGGVLT